MPTFTNNNIHQNIVIHESNKLLKKYNYRCPYTSNVSNYNRYLHDLLQLVGEEFNDTVITEVRKCSGHKSMKTFERYITFDED